METIKKVTQPMPQIKFGGLVFMLILLYNYLLFKLIDPIHYNDIAAYEKLFDSLLLEPISLSDLTLDGYQKRSELWGEFLTIILFQIASNLGVSALDFHIVILSIIWYSVYYIYNNGGQRSKFILASLIISPFSFGPFLMGATRQLLAVIVILIGYEWFSTKKQLLTKRRNIFLGFLYVLVYHFHYGSVMILMALHISDLFIYIINKKSTNIGFNAIFIVVQFVIIAICFFGFNQIEVKMLSYTINNVATSYDYVRGFFTYSILIPFGIEIFLAKTSARTLSHNHQLAIIVFFLMIVGSIILKNPGVDRVVTCLFFFATLRNLKVPNNTVLFWVSPFRILSLLIYLPGRLA